jgi:putative SOS response-associated peptidase YedK
LSLQALARRFKFLLPDAPDLPIVARYNLAPSQEAPVIASPAGSPTLSLMRWGLIPRWARDPAIGFKTINARAETLAEKPAFRDSFAARRCLVPADGFYEWRSAGRARLPMRITLKDGAPFAMAGLWDAWQGPGGREVRSFTIVTVPANETVAALHERMPAILRPADEAAWLDARASQETLAAALRPLEAAALALAPASSRVNAVANEGPELLKPEPPPPEQLTFP